MKKISMLMIAFLLLSTVLFANAGDKALINIALNKTIQASSMYTSDFAPTQANDGDQNTVWGSAVENKPQWIYIDLGSVTPINGIGLHWLSGYHARQYQIYVSNTMQTWTRVATVNKKNGEPDILMGEASLRYIGLYLTQKAGAAYGMKEFEVYRYGATPTPTATPTATPTSTPTPTTTVQPGLSFICTAVEDNLDPKDHFIMINAFKEMGCASIAENRNTSIAEMTSYMKTQATYMYHTGHGSPAQMRMSDGQYVNSMATIAIENVMIATCWSLQPTSWMNYMGPTCKNVAGYTDWTLDGDVDTAVAEDLAAELKKGGKFNVIWFRTHWPNPWVNSKWIVYSQEAGTIVEYSARSNNFPSIRNNNQVRITGAEKCLINEDILNNRMSGKYDTIKVQSNNGVTTTGTLDLVMADATGGEITEEEAIRIVKSQAGLPEGAVFETAVAIEAKDRDTLNTALLGYQVVFSRMINGLPVKGTTGMDQISCFVDIHKQITYTYTDWPDYTIERGSAVSVLPLADAVTGALPAINDACNGDVIEIIDAYPVYGTNTRDTLIPAYALITIKGEPIIIDAATGVLLK